MSFEAAALAEMGRWRGEGWRLGPGVDGRCRVARRITGAGATGPNQQSRAADQGSRIITWPSRNSAG